MLGFVINLDRRPERYERFVKEFKNVNSLTIERFSAVDHQTLNVTQFLKNRKISLNNSLKNYNNIIACYASHIKLYELFLNDPKYSSEEYLIIFEDDAAFISESLNFDIYFKEAMKLFIESDYGIMYLNNRITDKVQSKLIQTNITKLIPTQTHCPTSESYVVSRKFLKEMYDSVNKNVGAIDTEITKYIKATELKNKKAFSVRTEPTLICQFDRNDTDIQLIKKK